jgi:hypothetical protein
MNWLILSVTTLNLAVTITTIVIAKNKVDEAIAEMNLAKQKANSVIRNLSSLEF